MITMQKIPFVAHFWWQVCPQTLAESNPQHTHTHTHSHSLSCLIYPKQRHRQTCRKDTERLTECTMRRWQVCVSFITSGGGSIQRYLIQIPTTPPMNKTHLTFIM